MFAGYVPGAEALQAVSGMVDRLRQVNPDLIYVLDPVMGDDGKIYVSPEVVPIYKSLLPRANCATPNHFEAELLTDIKITSLAELKRALDVFHDRYEMDHIIISSIPSSQLGAEVPADHLVCAGSSRPRGSSDPSQQFMIPFPSLPEHYEGVGDVFSSLVLAHFSQPTLAQTAELAIASLQGILQRTRQHALQLAREANVDITGTNPKETPEERIRRLALVELRLVQSWREIRGPNVLHKARPITA